MTLEKINKINDFLLGMFKLIYLNILWLATTTLGLVVFGVGPATYALNKYLDQWLRLKNEPPLTKSFFKYFFERYWQACSLGVLTAGTLAIVIINLFNSKVYLIRLVNMLFAFLLLIGFTHLFKLMAATTFKKATELIRGSVLLGFGYLLQTVVAWAIVIGSYLLVAKFVPILDLIFGVGFAGFILSSAGNLIFKNVFKDDQQQVVPTEVEIHQR